MSHNIPADLKYTHEHEWLRIEGNEAVVGITEHAQELLGDMVFVDMPKVGQAFDAGADCAVVESVKAASDVYMPIKGTVLEANDALEASPELVNSDPYGDGWLFRIKIEDASEIKDLLDAEAYQALIAEE
jgi:glycine cleavage system H protein